MFVSSKTTVPVWLRQPSLRPPAGIQLARDTELSKQAVPKISGDLLFKNLYS